MALEHLVGSTTANHPFSGWVAARAFAPTKSMRLQSCNPTLTLSLAVPNPLLRCTTLHRYGTRLVVDSMEDDSDGEDSMWLSDDEDPQHQDWQQQGSHHHQQQQLQQEQQQAPGQEFLRQLAAATTAQQQQQQEGTHQPGSRPASAASDDEAAGSYFDDSYFGLPADASAAPHDLQVRLVSLVSVKVEVLGVGMSSGCRDMIGTKVLGLQLAWLQQH